MTEKGFLRPTYEALLEAQINRAKQLFGEDIETGEKTALGKFIRILVYDLAQVYEELEYIYYARFPNTATGISLDRLCQFVAITRNPASRASHTVAFTGTPEYEIPAGFLVSTIDNTVFYTEDPVILDETGTAAATVFCTEPGTAGNVKAGAIMEIVNPDASVERVSHIALAEAGKDTEMDKDLRKRFLLTIAGSGSSTVDAIRSEVMRVQGVQGCVIVENDTDGTDAAGRPPHSFEVFVLAPAAQDQLVAQAIFDKKPMGIKSCGAITMQVADNGGFYHDIRFSHVAEIGLYIKIKVLVNSFFEADGVAQIQSNLINHINSLGNGKDVTYSSLYAYIHKVAGVEEVAELLLSTDGEAYAVRNVVCSPSQVARVEQPHIAVEVSQYVDN